MNNIKIYFISLIFFNVSCNNKKHEITIDNTSEGNIKVLINNIPYEIQEKETYEIKLDTGTHLFKVFNQFDSLIIEKKIYIQKNGIFNPFYRFTLLSFTNSNTLKTLRYFKRFWSL